MIHVSRRKIFKLTFLPGFTRVQHMRKIIKYEHFCKRCAKKFVSGSKAPLRCGKCKTPYWRSERKTPIQKAA